MVSSSSEASSTFPHRLVKYAELDSTDDSAHPQSTVRERDDQLASRFRNDVHFDVGVVLHFELVHDAVRDLDPVLQPIHAPVHRLRELDLHHERDERATPPRKRRCQLGGGVDHHEDSGFVGQPHAVREAAGLELEFGLRVPGYVAVESKGRRVQLVDGTALPGGHF